MEIKNLIDFGVSRLKVKVTVTRRVKTIFRSITPVPLDPEPLNFIG